MTGRGRARERALLKGRGGLCVAAQAVGGVVRPVVVGRRVAAALLGRHRAIGRGSRGGGGGSRGRASAWNPAAAAAAAKGEGLLAGRLQLLQQRRRARLQLGPCPHTPPHQTPQVHKLTTGA